jgi:hypothetical protein
MKLSKLIKEKILNEIDQWKYLAIQLSNFGAQVGVIQRHMSRGNIKSVKREFKKFRKYVEFVQKTIDKLD